MSKHSDSEKIIYAKLANVTHSKRVTFLPTVKRAYFLKALLSADYGEYRHVYGYYDDNNELKKYRVEHGNSGYLFAPNGMVCDNQPDLTDDVLVKIDKMLATVVEMIDLEV